MFVILAVLLCLATTLFVASPWWRRPSVPPSLSAAPRGPAPALAERQEALLLELKELEFDHRMGKIDSSEYAELRAATAAAASAMLQPRAAEVDAEAEIMVARERLRRKSPQPATWTCGKCGRTMSRADQFCGSCGAARKPEQKAGKRRSSSGKV